MSAILAGRLAAGGELQDGWIEVEGSRIARTGHGAPPRPPDERPDGLIAPGLWDLQVNGAAGREPAEGGAALDEIDAVQLAHGVTSYLPALISPDDETAERVLAEIAARAADPASPVAGAHIEGPFISPDHAGVHPPDRLRAATAGIPAWWSSPAIRLVTLAPELAGALDLVAELTSRGTAVSLGHSGAALDQALAATERGARLVTHLFNAMAPLHHRKPGLAGAALTDERLAPCLIADGLHVHPAVLEIARRAAGPRVALVSDSSPAAAAPPGRYSMAGVPIVLGPDGAARDEAGRLAGSAVTLDACVRGWAEMTGATLAEALRAASEVPAAAVGQTAGISAGSRADLAIVDDAGFVTRVMRGGRWLD